MQSRFLEWVLPTIALIRDSVTRISQDRSTRTSAITGQEQDDGGPEAGTSATEAPTSALRGLMSPGLLLEPDRSQRVGAIEVVVRLDDQAVSQAVHDGEGLGIRRVAGAFPDHAGACYEAAIPTSINSSRRTLIGPTKSISVAEFNPDRDADGAYADRVVEPLESALRS
jgi:hypothetical protein